MDLVDTFKVHDSSRMNLEQMLERSLHQMMIDLIDTLEIKCLNGRLSEIHAPGELYLVDIEWTQTCPMKILDHRRERQASRRGLEMIDLSTQSKEQSASAYVKRCLDHV